MLFIFLSSNRFSVFTVASTLRFVPEAAPVVTPGDVFAPDDCAVPRLLVPGGGAGAFVTPPADPLDPPAPCAKDIAGIAARLKMTINVLIEALADNLVIVNSPRPVNGRGKDRFRNKFRHIGLKQEAATIMRKLIAFDEDTFDKLKQLGRDRMATFQELADEAFADLLKKHGIPIDLRDALRKSARLDRKEDKATPRSRTRKAKPR